jgi:hypothetical protein
MPFEPFDDFNAVGFDVKSTDDVALMLMVGHVLGQWLPVGSLHYLHMGPDTGIEVWGQADREKHATGARPHFIGTSRLRLRITRTLPTPGHPLDGAVLGEVVHPSEPLIGRSIDDLSTLYPLAVHLPDFGFTREAVELPGLVAVMQVAAFAPEVHCYASDEAFRTEGGKAAVMATESVIPTGTFSPGSDDTPARANEEPSPMALIIGHIETAELRHNPMTGKPFWWMAVRTYGGWVDMVVAADRIHGDPVPNGVVVGHCWLSGVISPDRRFQKLGLPPVSRGEGFSHPFFHAEHGKTLAPVTLPSGAGLPSSSQWKVWLGPPLSLLAALALAAPAYLHGYELAGFGGTVVSGLLLFELRGKPHPRLKMFGWAGIVAGLADIAAILVMRRLS